MLHAILKLIAAASFGTSLDKHRSTKRSVVFVSSSSPSTPNTGPECVLDLWAGGETGIKIRYHYVGRTAPPVPALLMLLSSTSLRSTSCTMVPRVLGAIACGACVASAFVAPAAVRSSTHQSDASARHSRSAIGRREGLSMTAGGGGGGGGDSQSRRDVIAGKPPKRGRDAFGLDPSHE